jgi:DNA-binding transcriptional LysR family regulator
VEGNWHCNNGYALMQAAVRGIGIAQLPEFYVRNGLDDQTLISCLEKYQPTDNGIWAVYPGNRHLSPKVRLFVDLLIEKYAERWS